MNLPRIAKALEPRPIPEHKMWFNPLAPVAVDEPEQPAKAKPAASVWQTEPAALTPKVVEQPGRSVSEVLTVTNEQVTLAVEERNIL